MPITRTIPLLACTALLFCASSQAAMETLDNQQLSDVTGQAGISIRLDVMARIDKLSWTDSGNSVSLRNIRIDNGCDSPSACPNGAGGSFALGPAQLGLTLPIFNIDQPTLMVDVVKNASGKDQLVLTLPDLTTINDQLIQSGLPAQRIRMRVSSDMYVGDSSLGNIEIRDIVDLRGTIKVWGH
ncbi:DUF6160 family protein [Pseudomonas sp. TUM22785]|uniref:DUF6160 family protein n=1 Tax=Pseudomonas sp. TUM22785 TaxID=3019098 RepID=UPI00230622AF|nr:DUF6160 family protein [Pseudomonas sp. TUM22785]WCD80761.1 DUF6160 family protein [Pseudomonas sp. TUM22785]